MNRAILKTNYGENNLQYTVRMESDPAPGESQDGFRVLVTMMQTLCEQPDLLRHGAACPVSVRFFHNGAFWVMEAASIVPRG